jgi:hypothetical protein
MQLLDDPSAVVGTATPIAQSLDLQVSGQTSHLYWLLFQKSNGKYYVVLWLGESLWNVSNATVLSVTAQTVTIQARRPSGSATVSTFSMSDGHLIQASQSFGGTISVSVGGMPVVVALP